ncbi:MAG: LysE family translocator [Betaproteobacteria bacterium]|nr:LysE family translocator [Betaproteobacteria bacterium]
MTASTLLLFSAAAIMLALTPGPTMLLALNNGIASGVRVAAYGIAGATLASALLISAVALGLGALLLASETLFNALRLIGVAYLCWLGYKLWQTPPLAINPSAQAQSATPLSPNQAFWRCASVSLSNPKALLFFSAFLPQFVDPSLPQAPQYLVLATIFLSIDAAVMLAYASAGRYAVNFLSARSVTFINRGCALAMLLLAATLAAFRRSNG